MTMTSEAALSPISFLILSNAAFDSAVSVLPPASK